MSRIANEHETPVVSADNVELNTAEKELLTRHEATIKQGLKTFFAVGVAFEEIQAKKLYREKYSNFEEYCREVWKISPSKAYRLKAGSKCIVNLKSRQLASGEKLAIPENEAQIRKMAGLEPDQQVQVARKVAKRTDKPTAKDFDDEVEKIEDEEKPRVRSYHISTQPHADDDEEADQAEPAANESPETMAPVKLDEKLVPLSEILQTVKEIYNIYSSSEKKQMGLKLFGKLQRSLEEWANWQAKHSTEKEGL